MGVDHRFKTYLSPTISNSLFLSLFPTVSRAFSFSLAYTQSSLSSLHSLRVQQDGLCSRERQPVPVSVVIISMVSTGSRRLTIELDFPFLPQRANAEQRRAEKERAQAGHSQSCMTQLTLPFQLILYLNLMCTVPWRETPVLSVLVNFMHLLLHNTKDTPACTANSHK